MPPLGTPTPKPPPPTRRERCVALLRSAGRDAIAGLRFLGNLTLFIAVISFCVSTLRTRPDLTPAVLEKTLQAAPSRVLLYFWQPGCPSCKRMEPMMAELEKTGRDIRVLRINARSCAEIADQYDIRGTPTLVVVERGRVRERNDGPFAERGEFMAFLQRSATRRRRRRSIRNSDGATRWVGGSRVRAGQPSSVLSPVGLWKPGAA